MTSRNGAGARARLVAHAQRLVPDDLAVGTSGNLSVRLGDEILITPGGMPYDGMTPADIVRIDERGAPADPRRRPSSELPMHRLAYEVSGAGAVVHTHSSYATAVACALDELPAVHYLLAAVGGTVPVVPYATFGSDELAHHMARGLAGRRAVLLGNHGVLTVGATLEEAYGHAVTVEWCAALYHRASQLGSPRILDDAEIEHVGERFRSLGYLAHQQGER
ncbi:class II aldolase/adducin family protein [Egibacter rhizosphaerae]|uniref:Class II aldolase/adducin family protein n=1 Tax=Egibacter rhizosphaerae TaxID=1670831 RepID=A0A411YBU5_9ACTN|nr:class II aldolase/adducin family protein [Egibacter rhizosphaerae]QBI18627.1 class II aldolase/adducin family protein [Egibacter rhizosphaerae]